MDNKKEVSTTQPETFSEDYYNKDYFVTPEGKSCIMANGETKAWSYANPTGDWKGAIPIVRSWKETFDAKKMLDVGAGRGTFVGYASEIGIDAHGFDFSSFAVSDEGRFAKCSAEQLIQHDVTKAWPYEGGTFDLIVCLDLMEHLYEEDIDFVIDEMVRVSSKYVFLQIAVSHNVNYSLKKGAPIPKEYEVCTLTGHVLVQNKEWWIKRLKRTGCKFNTNLVERFFDNVIPAIEPESAWIKNLVIVLEKE